MLSMIDAGGWRMRVSIHSRVAALPAENGVRQQPNPQVVAGLMLIRPSHRRRAACQAGGGGGRIHCLGRLTADAAGQTHGRRVMDCIAKRIIRRQTEAEAGRVRSHKAAAVEVRGASCHRPADAAE